VQLDQRLGERQAEAGALVRMGAAVVRLAEGLQDVLDVIVTGGTRLVEGCRRDAELEVVKKDCVIASSFRHRTVMGEPSNRDCCRRKES
jgi:hypothetical protein